MLDKLDTRGVKTYLDTLEALTSSELRAGKRPNMDPLVKERLEKIETWASATLEESHGDPAGYIKEILGQSTALMDFLFGENRNNP